MIRAERDVLAAGATRRRQTPRPAPLPSPRGLVQHLISAVRKTQLEIPLPIRFAPLVTVVVTAVPHNYGFLGGSQNAVSAHARRVSGSVPG